MHNINNAMLIEKEKFMSKTLKMQNPLIDCLFQFKDTDRTFTLIRITI